MLLKNSCHGSLDGWDVWHVWREKRYAGGCLVGKPEVKRRLLKSPTKYTYGILL
jgi:hypothetical protein